MNTKTYCEEEEKNKPLGLVGKKIFGPLLFPFIFVGWHATLNILYILLAHVRKYTWGCKLFMSHQIHFFSVSSILITTVWAKYFDETKQRKKIVLISFVKKLPNFLFFFVYLNKKKGWAFFYCVSFSIFYSIYKKKVQKATYFLLLTYYFETFEIKLSYIVLYMF